MTVYSIFVKGQCDVVSDRFTCHSKEIYVNHPTQEQVDDFIERCSKGGFINLKKDAPYEVTIVEHPLIED